MWKELYKKVKCTLENVKNKKSKKIAKKKYFLKLYQNNYLKNFKHRLRKEF